MTVTGDGVMSETGGSVCLGSATVYSLLRDAAIANAELTAVTFIEDGDTFSAVDELITRVKSQELVVSSE